MEQESGFEQLFEEREWVRALAERLCADAASAEDLAQDTWLEALREGGKARGARGWLGGVLRNLVARRRTRDAARSERERATARPETVPGPDELLARAELQRRVLSAVAELPESYRSVVLLRHYEGLSAEDIARRSGESGSTVRNRLARAHALLRERLDRDYGERSLWSTLLVPVSWGVSKEVVTGGVLVGAKLYVTAAAVALVGAVLWMRTDEPEAVAETLATVENAASPERRVESEPTEAPRGSEARSEVEPAAVAPRFDSVLVHGELRGVSGSLDSMSLTFTDALGRGRRATLNGTSFAVPGLEPGEWRVTSGMRGYRTLDQHIELDGSQPNERRDFELEPLRSVRVKLVDASSGEWLKTSFSSRLLGCLSVIATRTRDAQVPRTLQRRLLASEAGHYEANDGFGGSGQSTGSCSGVLTLTEATPLWLHVVLRDIVVATQAYDGGSDEVEFALDVQALQKLEGSLLVRCVDDLTGAPIAGARIEASFEDGGGGGMPSAAEGLVRLTGLPPGLQRVSAWVTQRPTTSVVARVEPGAEVELELRIPRAVRMTGQVIAAGVGRRATIEILPSTAGAAWDPWRELGRSNSGSDGRFEFPVMPAIRQRLVVYVEGFALAVRDVDATRGDVDLGEIVLEAGTPVLLRSALGDARTREVLLLDSQGVLLQKRNVSPAGPARWTLAPGTYGLRVFRDSEIVEERTLVVGTELLRVELGRQ